MVRKAGIAVWLLSIASIFCFCDGLSFAAFNIKWLTPSKYDKPIVQKIIPKILKLYDITLIQELRGDGKDVMKRIVADLSRLTNQTYGYVMSDKIGRTSYKEQYAFLFREQGSFTIREVLQYRDTADDFEREPYIIRVNDPTLDINDFAIVGVHIKPDRVVNELNKLHDVYTYVDDMLGVKSVLFAGDFNADCSYLRSSKLVNLEFYRDSRFTWLIGSSADTTVNTNTDCAYDRFILTNDLNAEVVKGSEAVLNYQTEFSLSYAEAKTVSDHFPISLKFSRDG